MEEVSFEMGAERSTSRRTVAKRVPDAGCSYTKALSAKGWANDRGDSDTRTRRLELDDGMERGEES